MSENPMQVTKIELETTIFGIGDGKLLPEPITIPANSYLAVAYTKDWKPAALGIYNEQGELQRTITLQADQVAAANESPR